MARRGRPASVRAAIGVFCLAVGSLLSLRPFCSAQAAVLAVAIGLLSCAAAEGVQGTREAPARWLLALFSVSATAVVVAWPRMPVPVLAVVVGSVLILTGALELWSGLLASSARLPTLLVGAAAGGPWLCLSSGLVTLALGVLATLWWDAVMLPMAIALGVRLVIVGAGLLVDIWYPPSEFGSDTEVQRIVGRAVAAVLAVALIVTGIIIDGGRPLPTAFYYRDLAPGTVAGSLLAAQDRAVPAGVNGSAVGVLYATDDPDRGFLAASAVLYLPKATSGSSLPLVVWSPDATGIGQGCAASVLGSAAAAPGLATLLARGTAVLVVDGIGLGSPGPASYLVGQSEGRAILDAVAAAAQVPGVRFGAVVLWGLGEGGHAALWASRLQPELAPRIRLAGVAAVAPVIDPLAEVADAPAGTVQDRLDALLVESYASHYADVRARDYLGTGELAGAELAGECASGTVFSRAWTRLSGLGPESVELLRQGAVAVHAAQNDAPADGTGPLLLLQGAQDEIVPEAGVAAFAGRACAAGRAVNRGDYAGLGHADLLAPTSPAVAVLLAWSAQRFAGTAPGSDCAG